jgi:hypothetical protein
MKKIFINKFFLFLFIATVFTVLSCDKEVDDVIPVGVDSGKATLLSFGPSPVLRGGELSFIGRHLDRVTEIILPSNVSVKTFKTKEEGKITLTVPEATVNGAVVLKTSDGDITALSDLTISEPITLVSIAPAEARPGATIALNGTYLNLIKQVIFASNKVVDAKDFVSQSRDKLEVKVPLDAQTGKVTISNGLLQPILVVSENDFAVTLPVATKISPIPAKAGTNLTITGTDLDLIKTFTFGGAKKAVKIVSQTATSAVIEIPADAQDGKLTLTVASGVDVSSNEALTMVVPSDLAATPIPAKNGKVVTITGKDLDLVSSIEFGGAKVAKIVSQTATKIEAEVPIDATEGVATLKTKANKSVTTAAITLLKPVITSFAPTSIKANNPVVITGTDLDLITSVVFGGDKTVKITNTNATSLSVTVPSGTLTGAFKVITANGTTVTSATPLTLLASNVPTVTGFPKGAKPGQLITLTGTKMSLLTDVIFPTNIKASTFGVKTEDKIEVIVPLNVKLGLGKIKFMTAEGETSETDDIAFTGVDPVVDPSLVFFDFDSKGAWWGKMQNNTRTDAEGISGKYGFVNGESLSGWNDLFWRNGGNDFPGTKIGKDAANYVLKVDINIKEPLTGGCLHFRLNGDEGDFWYGVGPEAPNAGNKTFIKTTGWETLTIDVSAFRDNFGWGNLKITDLSKISKEFGCAWNNGASKVNILVDNVRFEKK